MTTQRTKSIDEMSIQELQAELQRLEEASQSQVQEIKRLTGERDGFLITAPNPAFEGKLFEVEFRYGQTFMPADKQVSAFIFEPEKESTLVKLGYSPEQIAAVRDREQNVTSAQRAASAFEHDFGYQVEYFTADQFDELRRRMAARAIEASRALSALEDASTKMASMNPPSRFAGLVK
jgi:hypothetical protein